MAKDSRPVDRLKIVLEEGYLLIEKRKLFSTPRIPRNWEDGFDPRGNNFNKALRQQSINGDFHKWESSLLQEFSNARLSWARFRRKTEDIDEKVDNYSEASIIKRKIDELDNIVNNSKVFDSYVVPSGYPKITLENGNLTQGLNEHKFTESHATSLLETLWPSRRIISPDSKELQPATPADMDEILSSLKMSKLRFETVVRNISTMAHRKNINVRVKYPKGKNVVYLELTQDIL